MLSSRTDPPGLLSALTSRGVAPEERQAGAHSAATGSFPYGPGDYVLFLRVFLVPTALIAVVWSTFGFLGLLVGGDPKYPPGVRRLEPTTFTSPPGPILFQFIFWDPALRPMLRIRLYLLNPLLNFFHPRLTQLCGLFASQNCRLFNLD